MCTRKPFLCYLRDAVLPQQRFVSSFAKRIKAPNKKKINKKAPTVWQSFIVEGAKLISAADTWVQISEIPVSPPPPWRGAKKRCVWGMGCVSDLSVGEKKVCFTGMIKAKVCVVGNKWASPGVMAEKQRRKQGNGRFYELISERINSSAPKKAHQLDS